MGHFFLICKIRIWAPWEGFTIEPKKCLAAELWGFVCPGGTDY